MSLIGATAIQGAANIGAGLVQNLFAKRNLGMQTQANKELADHAYDKDLQMWHLQNLYNDPKNQMQRFREAGLNPNLMYGKGTSGNATAMPKAQQVTAGRHTPQMPKIDMLGLYQNVQHQAAQTANVKANTGLTNEATTLKMTEAAIKNIDLTLKGMERDWWQGENLFHKSMGQKRNNYQATMNQKWKGLLDKTQAGSLAYSLNAKKLDLSNLTIQLAQQRLLTEIRKYKWMPWEKGVGLGSKVLGNITGLAGVGKLGKLGRNGKFSKGTKPRLSTPKPPRGFNYYNQANNAFKNRYNPY